MPKNKEIKTRPPIVVVLGHVDHGKTSLLDYIRKTSVTKKEAGGITQSIGASQITIPEGKKITFIDTPGHSAFSSMRSRGAKLADIAVLVVAVNDGVKPQTKEALEYILATNTPFIVAATKTDLPQSSLDLVRKDLQAQGVSFEGQGGEVPLVGVSAKNGEGVTELLDTISLLSELKGIESDMDAHFEAGVIETSKDNVGLLVSAVIKNGSLSVGDELVSEVGDGKVRALKSHDGKRVQKAGPGDAVSILGFNNLPSVGSTIWKKEEKMHISLTLKEGKNLPRQTANQADLTVLVKASNTGSLEAVTSNLPEDVFVVGASVGDVTESDIFMAKSSSAIILVFESKVPNAVLKLAEMEGVTVEKYAIIYHLFEKIEELLQMGKVEIVGTAEVVATFPFNGKTVAGSKIKTGVIKKGDVCILKRDEKELGEVKIMSIRKGKSEVSEVKQGEECGILFSPQLDFKLSDMLLSIRK